jgi:hypothetical protein
VPGECLGSTIVGLTFPQNVKECSKDCKEKQDCKYFTYHQDGTKYCNLLDGCNRFSTNCSQCLSGEVSCPDDIQIVDDSQYKCNLTGMCQVSRICSGFLILFS